MIRLYNRLYIIYIHILYILLYICYAAQHGKRKQILTNTPQLNFRTAQSN